MNRKLKFFSLTFLISLTSQFLACSSSSEDPTVFEIKFENVATSPSFFATNRTPVITAFSSMIAVIHENQNLLFTENFLDKDQGLAELAQNGDTATIAQMLQLNPDVEIIGIANEPSAGSAGILTPGQSFTLILSTTSPSSRISIASSFLQGNDIVAMTRDDGIPLFDQNGVPLSGNITSFFNFYDTGTERNEAPGIGANQVIRQGVSPANQVSAGVPESAAVRTLDDGFNYPSVAQSIRVTISVIEAGTTFPSPTVSASPSPTVSASPSPTVSASPSPSPSPSSTASPNQTSVPTASSSPDVASENGV